MVAAVSVGNGCNGAGSQLTRLGRLIENEPAIPGAPDGARGRLHRLCTVLTRVLPAAGAGISVLTDDLNQGGILAAVGQRSRAVEELQFSLGEGPCLEAFTSRRPVLEPDLPGPGRRRWPVYAPAAHDYGVRAVFAFPLQVGATRLGALGIYRAETGPLPGAALSHAATFADITLGLLLDAQAAVSHGGTLRRAEDLLGDRAEIFQAQGMVMVDLGVGLAEAMARLRAHAFTGGRPLLQIARDVLAGTLKLDRDIP